jgi:sporulation integral membrane protein YlbJ
VSRLLGKAWVRELLLGAALLCATAMLMMFPQEGVAAAKDGLTLCYNVIIPSLFPFFVLSSLVVELGLAGYLGRSLEKVMRPLFNLSGACASAVALGFVGGYPVGAKTAISLYQNGACTKTEAERLLAFCNNSSPAFILGVVGAGVFASSSVGIFLYLAHALASVCVGLLFRFYKSGGRNRREARAAPQFQTKRLTTAFTGSVTGSFLSTLNICAFIVFFTVVIKMLFLSGVMGTAAAALSALLAPLGFSAEWAQRLLTGVIELSSGVWALAGSGALAGRMSMAAFMLGWAGVSVHCQVLSFLGDSGLSPRTYLVGKTLHGGLSALFTALLCRVFPLDATVASYIAEQVEGMANMDFQSALILSTVAAWVVGLAFLLVAAMAVRNRGGKMRRSVV